MPDDGFTYSLENFEYVGDMFSLIGRKADQQVINGLIEAAEWAIPRIKEITPVGDDPAHAGRLRDSIGHSGIIETSEGPSIIIGTDQPYGRRVELGFEGTDSAGRTYHQQPQPYIEPVLDELLDQLTRDIKL